MSNRSGSFYALGRMFAFADLVHKSVENIRKPVGSESMEKVIKTRDASIGLTCLGL
jgi:hypothetical protein